MGGTIANPDDMIWYHFAFTVVGTIQKGTVKGKGPR